MYIIFAIEGCPRKRKDAISGGFLDNRTLVFQKIYFQWVGVLFVHIVRAVATSNRS